MSHREPVSGEASPLGAPDPRREDARLLTGTGTFTDNIALPAAVHAHFVRSPHAHARILGIDARAAQGPAAEQDYSAVSTLIKDAANFTVATGRPRRGETG